MFIIVCDSEQMMLLDRGFWRATNKIDLLAYLVTSNALLLVHQA